MANFPTSIFSPRAVADRVGVVYDALKTKVFFAKDHNDFGNEIVAIETILGTNPEGEFSDVKDRLDDLDDYVDKYEEVAKRKARVVLSANQENLVDNTYTKILFDSENYDPNEDYDSSVNHRYISSLAGYYLITMELTFGSVADQKLMTGAIYKNGNNVKAGFNSASGTNSISVVLSDIIHLDVDDYIEIFARSNNGDNVVDIVSGVVSHFSVHCLSAD